MKQSPLSQHILSVFLCSLVYWIYLALATHMDISCDALGYEGLGRILQNNGLITYVKTGPNREPLYPSLVALSMTLEQLTHYPYVKIMAYFGVVILLVTQILIYILLRLLKIRSWICSLVLVYFAISPAITNTAFSLFSEIITYPLILGIILANYAGCKAIENDNKIAACGYGLLTGLTFAATTFVKGIFECVFPTFLIVILITAMYKKNFSTALILFLMTSAVVFYVPILEYKQLNKTYNGNFTIADRGPWGLYGNTARRVEPIESHSILTDLAYVAGEGVCEKFFSSQECYFWSFQQSDGFGGQKLDELKKQHLDPQEATNQLLRLSKEKALSNLPQYLLLTFIESLKMFFWESTQIGFVTYPAWLSQIYNMTILKNLLRLCAAVLTAFAWLSCCRYLWRQQTLIIFLILSLVFIFVSFSSLFSILPRYMLPVAPLYLVLIGFALETVITQKKKFDLSQ